MEFYNSEQIEDNERPATEPIDFEGFAEWLAEQDAMFAGIPAVWIGEGEESGR